MNFQNLGILEGSKKIYKVLYNRNRGMVEIEKGYLNLYHPYYTKKIMFEEIESIIDRYGKVFFSIVLKDGSMYTIGFPFQQSVGTSIAESIRDIRSLKMAKRDKELFLGILKNKIKENKDLEKESKEKEIKEKGRKLLLSIKCESCEKTLPPDSISILLKNTRVYCPICGKIVQREFNREDRFTLSKILPNNSLDF